MNGNLLKDYRKSKNISQLDFAEMIGISRSWLSKLENNKILYRPQHYTRAKICKLTGISHERLFE